MDIIDVDEIKNSGGELITLAKDQAQQRLQQQFSIALRDGTKRVMAFQNKNMILCAKKYIYGNIVSCHQTLLKLAEINQTKFVMYVEEPNTFYEFDPSECLLMGILNKRGGITMCNFSIGLGTNIEGKKEMQV